MADDLYDLPASTGQEQMHLIHQMHRGRASYVIRAGLRLRGPVDAGIVEQVIAALVDRHEILRTVIRMDRNGETRQVIQSGSDVSLTTVAAFDHEADEDARRGFTHQWPVEFAQRPFDLHNGPILRCALVRLGTEDYLFAIVIHHIAADGWSLMVLTEDFGELYRAASSGDSSGLPELPLQYADFAVWQRESLASGALDEQRTFWRERLAGMGRGELPADPDVQTAEVDANTGIELYWPTDLVAAMSALGRSHGATTFMVLLSGFAVALARWSGLTDFVVATPVDGRRHEQLDRVVGYFVNTLPLRVRLDGDPGFGALVDRVRDSWLSSYANQDVPYEQILADLSTSGRPRMPLAPALFAYNNFSLPRIDELLPGITVEPIEIPTTSTGGFDVAVDVTEQDGALNGYLVGATDKYTSRTLWTIVEEWKSVLLAAIDADNVAVSQLNGSGLLPTRAPSGLSS